MRTTIIGFVLVSVLTLPATGFAARPGHDGDTPSGNVAPGTAIVVDPFFKETFEEVLAASPTLRDEYDRIAASPHVRVWVAPLHEGLINSTARTTFGRSSGVLMARVEVVSPLREFEFAEMLAHEFEHVLEQVEGVRLDALAGKHATGVSKFSDGAFETDRAHQVGRAAAVEVERNIGQGR